MSHLSYKSRQTAALYVANDLADDDRESFELHMMNCSECVDDVETWRVLARGVSTQAAPARAPAQLASAANEAAGTRPAPPVPPVTAHAWQLAASVILATTLGLVGGWLLQGRRAPLDDAALGFASLAGPTRSGNCTVVRIAAANRVVAVRIPGALPGTDLVATRADGRPLGSDDYSVRGQPDGSWLLRLTASAVVGKEVLLESRDRAGNEANEPVGCLSAIVVP